MKIKCSHNNFFSKILTHYYSIYNKVKNNVWNKSHCNYQIDLGRIYYDVLIL